MIKKFSFVSLKRENVTKRIAVIIAFMDGDGYLCYGEGEIMNELKEAKLSLQSQLGKDSETSKIRRDELDYDMLAPLVLSTLAE